MVARALSLSGKREEAESTEGADWSPLVTFRDVAVATFETDMSLRIL